MKSQPINVEKKVEISNKNNIKSEIHNNNLKSKI
jgi:hypothetical protein